MSRSRSRPLSALFGSENVSELGRNSSDVTGLQGRVRLQKGDNDDKENYASPNRGVKWMDSKREYLQAYEYLCHVEEARKWMETCIGEHLPASVELETKLRNGVILAKLARACEPDLVKRIHLGKRPDRVEFRHSDNINAFFRWVALTGLPEVFRFELIDVYEGKNIPKVIYCLHALSYLLSSQGLSKPMSSLLGKVEFSADDIETTQKGLDHANVNMPNFAGLASAFGEEAESDGPSEEELQEEELRRSLKNIIQLQSAVRGAMVRADIPWQIEMQKEFENWVTALQAASRGYGTRKSLRQLKTDLRAHSDLTVRLQTCCRAAMVRTRLRRDMCALNQERQAIVSLQALARGYISRASFSRLHEQVKLHEQRIVDLQSALRAAQVRLNTNSLRTTLASFTASIIDLQASSRGFTARALTKRRMAYFNRNMNKVIKFQSLVRAHQQGKAYKSLIINSSPPLSTVKTFIHLLCDGNIDFSSEMKIAQLRRDIVQNVKANEQMEEHIEQLDAKIALLVRNKITLDEVLRHQSKFSKKMSNLSSEMNSETFGKMANKRLDLFKTFFFLLQTKSSYLARLLLVVQGGPNPDKATVLLETLILNLFTLAQNPREEYYLLRVLSLSMQMDVRSHQSLQTFVRSPKPWLKIAISYIRGPKEKTYLRRLFAPVLQLLHNADDLQLTTDPIVIYRTMVNNEELQTGQRTRRVRAETAAEAIQDPQTRQQYIKNLRFLRVSTNEFIQSLASTSSQMPYGMRYLARVLRDSANFDAQSNESLVHTVGSVIIAKYFQPCIASPDKFSIVEDPPSSFQQTFFSNMVRVVCAIGANKPFDASSDSLATLNTFIENAQDPFRNAISLCLATEEPSEHFNFDDLDDYVTTNRPTLYMKAADVESFIGVASQHIDQIASSVDDPLRATVLELDTVSHRSSDENSELAIQLNPKQVEVDDDAIERRSAFVKAKQLVMDVIRVQSGTTLLQVLTKPVTDEDECKWSQVRDSDEHIQAQRSPQVNDELFDRQSFSFSDIKRMALHSMIRLEKLGLVNRADDYQVLISSIANDIRSKHKRRLQRNQEQTEIQQTLAELEGKKSYLKEQIDQYNSYVEKCMDTLARKGKKKGALPFTKQYFHMRNLQKSGHMPEFGSFKYSASKLVDKHVIQEFSRDSKWDQDRVDFTLSSNDPGVFTLEASEHGIPIPGWTAILHLDEILQAQSESLGTLSACGGMISLNVDDLLRLVYKLFYSSK